MLLPCVYRELKKSLIGRKLSRTLIGPRERGRLATTSVRVSHYSPVTAIAFFSYFLFLAIIEARNFVQNSKIVKLGIIQNYDRDCVF